MKRTIRCLLPALVLLTTVSCMTLYNAEDLQSIGNVAVVSIQADRHIDAGTMDDIAAVARAWARSEELDLVPAASRIRTSLFNTYARSLPFSLAEERTLLESEAYRGLASDGIGVLSAREAAVPEGYLAVPLGRRKDLQKLIARFPEVNGFLWAEVRYTLVKKNEFMGTVFVTMRADLTVTVLDRRARAVLRRMTSAEDATEMRIVVAGAVRVADIAAAALRATERASSEMTAWLEARGTR